MLLTVEELVGIPAWFCAQLPKEHAVTKQALVRRAVLNTSQHNSVCALPKIQRLLLINQPQQGVHRCLVPVSFQQGTSLEDSLHAICASCA